MVGPRLAKDEEYLKAVKDHILGMIVTTRVQFLVPDCLKRWCDPFLMGNGISLIGLCSARYIGGLISRLATLGTRWDMHASRRVLLRHFAARSAEYREEMVHINSVDDQQTSPGMVQEPVSMPCLLHIYQLCS